MHPLTLAANLWGLSGFAWTIAECCAYYRRMRRQAELGMGDALVRNRFRLWCVWTGACVALPLCVLIIKGILLPETGAQGEAAKASPAMWWVLRAVVLSAGGVALAAIWLSFFPPRAYVARLRHSASA